MENGNETKGLTINMSILMLLVLVSTIWGILFPGSWADSSNIILNGTELQPGIVMLGVEIVAILFLVLGLIKNWDISFGRYIEIKSREFYLFGSLLIIIGSFMFNGFDVLGFILYYYELIIISSYYFISLTFIPAILTILIGVVVTLLGFILYGKKEDLDIWKYKLYYKHSSAYLIVGVIILFLGYLLSSLYQPNYVGTFGDPETDGILRTITGLVFSSDFITALSDFYLHQVLYLYPLVLFACGIYSLKLTLSKEEGHSFFTTKFKDDVETVFPKIVRFTFLIFLAVLVSIVVLFITITISWYLYLDTSFSEIWDLQVGLFKLLLSLFGTAILLNILIFLPKVISPFLDSRILRYSARRVLGMFPLLIGISIISYGLMAATGNPVDFIISRIPVGHNRDIIYQNLMRIYGLNAPVQSQWFNWFLHFIMGDLGNSIAGGGYVAEVIGDRVIPTLEISITPLFLALAVSIPLGIYSALKQYSWQDNAIALFVSFGLSIPVFLLIILCILAFAYYIPILPPSGRGTLIQTAVGVNVFYATVYFQTFISELFEWTFWDSLWHLILPIFAITIISLALYVRLIRSGYLEIIQQDYILSAQAYGFKDRTIIYRHALKNVLIPIVTYIGLSIGGLLGGAPLTETTLSWPGLGSYGIQAIQSYDYPVVMGLILTTAVLILIANLLTDIIYSVIDPRVTI